MEKIKNKRKKEFDYYIYVDYSENLSGYSIIEKSKLKELLPKISKLTHYRKVVHKRAYLVAIRKRFEREEIAKLLLKWKIRNIRENTEIFLTRSSFINHLTKQRC